MTLSVGFDTVPEQVSAAGVERHARELLAALSARPDLEVHRLGPAPRRPAHPLQTLARGLVREAWWYPAGLAAAARRARVDVVHAIASFVPLGMRAPLVLTVPDVLPLRHPELFPSVVVAHHRAVLVPRARRAARLLASTEHARGEIVDVLGVDADRVVVTPLGVEARFRPVVSDARRLRDRFGIDRPYVLCVGTLEPRKNLVGALRGMRAAGLGDEVALVIAGGRGWRNEAFEAEAAHTGVPLIVAGRVTDDELIELYGGARCLVFPSLWEGYGLPALEAMACGCPVISSDRSALPEVVGDAGMLVDPLDAEAIGAAVRELVTDDARRAALAERGRRRAAGMTWARTAELTRAVYRELTGA